MEFVRKIVNGTDLKEIVEMPVSLINQRVEILIFPVDTKTNKSNKNKKSLAGFLSKYANPNLISKEDSAWFEEANLC